MDEQSLKAAAEQLAKSERGRRTLAVLLNWLDNDGMSLDGDNKRAVHLLLWGAWGEYPGTARDVMRQALGPYDPEF